MTVGEKIRKFRTTQHLSQKQLAIMAGLSEPAVRNYELGNRQPSEKQIEKIASALQISPFAITDPSIDNMYALMHTLFALEDNALFVTKEINGEIVLAVDKENSHNLSLQSDISEWQTEKTKLISGEISKEDYDLWRYSFPRLREEQSKKSRDSKYP